MALNFASCDREQLLLMPPSLMEWLPENHLVWTILGAVDQMDLGRFNEAYRAELKEAKTAWDQRITELRTPSAEPGP